MSVNFPESMLLRLTTRKNIFFIIIVLALLPFLNFISTGPVKDSIANAEHWVNLTNAIFIQDQDLIFSYGPLFWLVGGVSEYYNAYSYYASIAFSLVFYSVVLWSILILMHRAKGYLFVFLTAICFFSFYYLKVFLFLWPLLFLFYKQYNSQTKYFISIKLCLILGLVAGLFLYIRFFYGLIAIAVIGGYLTAQFFKDYRFKEIIAFVSAFLVSSAIFGMLIYGDVNLLAKYFTVNMQLSYGNAVDMTLDIKNYRFAFLCSFIVLACFVVYGIRKQAYFILPLIVTWLLLFKLGFGRADHYITYFVVPCAFIAMLISLDKGYLTKLLFLVSFVSLYYLGTHSAYSHSPKLSLAFSTFNMPSLSNPFKLPFSEDISYDERMAQKYRDYKLNDEIVSLVGGDPVDIYPYNNEYMYANKLNYKPRPLFQNYMTLTPVLDQANADYLSGDNKPKSIIWNSGLACVSADCNSLIGIDNKFILNEDPLTSMAILENYNIHKLTYGKNNEPMLLLLKKENPQSAAFELNKIEHMKFGEWYSLPDAQKHILKIYPDFKISMLGKLKNFLFRGDVVRIKYLLKSGVVKEYRLSIINSRSGVWASPLLDGFDVNGFTGEDVAKVMFETDSSYYFKPEFETKIFVAQTPLIHYQRRKIKYNEPVVLPSSTTIKEIDCDASIDEMTAPVLDGEGEAPIIVKGWLAKSTAQGVLFDKTYITLTDGNQRKIYFSSTKNSRGDLTAVFGKAVLENAGYMANIDPSELHGPYTVSLSGQAGNEVFACKNMKMPLVLN